MKQKKTIKINFENWGWDTENNLFINLLKKDYHVVISEDPDFVFFNLAPPNKSPGIRKFASNLPFLRKRITNLWQSICALPILGTVSYSFFQEKPKMPVIKTKAKRIFYTCENVRPDMDNCEWAFTSDYDEDLNNPRHIRLPWYKFSENESINTKNLVKKKVDFAKIKKQKTKFCAFIYSKNVPFRNNFFKALSKYKRVDSPGNCMRNMPSFGQQAISKERFIPSKEKKTWQKEKIDFLKPYKFTISFENSSYPGYTTEKIYHPMLVNSIPIYWGNRKVGRDFNTKSFLNYYDFEEEAKRNIPKLFFKIPGLKKIISKFFVEPRTIKKIVNRIIEIDNDDKLYEKYLKEPWYPNNRLTKYVDDTQIRKSLKRIFG